MLATVVVVWCVGSFVLALVVGRAIRGARLEPTPASQSLPKVSVPGSLEVA
jgi:hypothetical protein